MPGEPLIVLSGPTASGKSAVALALASALPLEIVGADSVQVYRGMDVGSAKPSPAERAAAPHHLIDVADPDEDFDAGRFVAAATAAIASIRSRGRAPLVVGGTGMYIRALLRGLDPLPRDPEVRRELARLWEREGAAALHARLAQVDPSSAATIHPRDRVRVLRALEIHRLTGKAPSAARGSWAAGSPRRFDVLFLALRLGREELYRRIDARVDGMIRQGLVEEVRGLLARGYGPGLKSMMSLGYRHAAAHLLQGVPLEAAVAELKRDTRRYAKRQETWLAREEGVHRLEGDSAAGPASELARKLLS